MDPMYEKFRASEQIEKNLQTLDRLLGTDISFDCIHLDLEYAGRKMALFFIDGFIKDDIFVYIMQGLAALRAEEIDERPLERLMKTYIPYVEIAEEEDLARAADFVLAGQAALVIDGVDRVILIDARTYPARSPQEPDMERVVRGSRDGYVETLVFNTALTRRRVRDRSLRMEYMQVRKTFKNGCRRLLY